MPEEDKNQLEIKLRTEIAESLSKSLNIPVFVINPEAVNKILEGVKQEIPDIEKKYSSHELHEEVSSFVSKFTVMRPKDEAETEKRIKDFLEALEKEKPYEAFIILPSVIGVPVGTKIGSLEIVEQEIDDKHFLEFLNHHKEHKRLYIDGRTQAKVSFSAYTTVDVTKVLYKILELPFAILSLILDTDLDARDCVGMVKSPDVSLIYYLEPQRESRGWSKYRGMYFDEYLERLSKISIDKKPTSLQKKILQALQVYGLSRLSQKAEIRFLFLVSSFESLLLTENDRDYLGKKISEKTAFLLEKDYEKRLKLYKQMKSSYGKRSGLVHSGKTQISDSDVRNLESIFQATVFKLLELSITYSKMEQRERESQQEGVEDFINRLKFA
jgi:hypothetical protein